MRLSVTSAESCIEEFRLRADLDALGA